MGIGDKPEIRYGDTAKVSRSKPLRGLIGCHIPELFE